MNKKAQRKKNTLLKYFSPPASDTGKKESKVKANFKRKALQDLSLPAKKNSVSRSAMAPQMEVPIAVKSDEKFDVGALVNVQSRTWAGINKPGGVARIVASDEAQKFFHVKYVFGGSEKGVALDYISLYEDLTDENNRAKRLKRTKLIDSDKQEDVSFAAPVPEKKKVNTSTKVRVTKPESTSATSGAKKRKVARRVVSNGAKPFKVISKNKGRSSKTKAGISSMPSTTRNRTVITERKRASTTCNLSSRKRTEGEKVFARFTDGRWYWGTIVSKTKTGSHIKFDDGDVRSSVPAFDILTKEEVEGRCRVYAKFTDGHWYWGTLLGKNKTGTLCNICFDDGDISDTVTVRHVLTKSEVEARAATLSRTKNVGDRVFAEYTPGAWFWGVVASIQGRMGPIHVVYDDGDERRGVPPNKAYTEKEAYEQNNIIPPPLESTLKASNEARNICDDDTIESEPTPTVVPEVRSQSESTEVSSASAGICGETISSKSAPNTSDEKLIDPVSLKDSNEYKSPLTLSNLGYKKDNSVSTPTSKCARRKSAAAKKNMEHSVCSPTTTVTNNFTPKISLDHPGKINLSGGKFSNLEELVRKSSDVRSEMHPSLANSLHRALMGSEPQTGHQLLLNQAIGYSCTPPLEDLTLLLRSILHGAQNEGINLSDIHKQQMIADYATHPLIIKQMHSCWKWDCYPDVLEAPLHSKQVSVWNRTSCALEYIARLFSEVDGVLSSCDNVRQTLRQTNAALALFNGRYGDAMQCADKNSRIEHIQAVTRLVMAFGTLSIKLANFVSMQEGLCKKDMMYLCLAGFCTDDVLYIILEDMLEESQ